MYSNILKSERCTIIKKLTMPDIKALVQKQILLIKDPIVKSGLELMLTEPTKHLRDWDYGDKGEQFECWTIAIDNLHDTSIVYSDFGFGPSRPWGLVFTSKPWIGMDSGWFDNLEECFLGTWIANDLPIWCVEKEMESGIRKIIEQDLISDNAFKIRDNLAKEDITGRYHVVSRKNNSAQHGI